MSTIKTFPVGIRNEAVSFASALVTQAGGDASKARRACAEAMPWLQFVDPTFDADKTPEGLTAKECDDLRVKVQALQAQVDEGTLPFPVQQATDVAVIRDYAQEQELRADNAEAETQRVVEQVKLLQAKSKGDDAQIVSLQDTLAIAQGELEEARKVNAALLADLDARRQEAYSHAASLEGVHFDDFVDESVPEATTEATPEPATDDKAAKARAYRAARKAAKVQEQIEAHNANIVAKDAIPDVRLTIAAAPAQVTPADVVASLHVEGVLIPPDLLHLSGAPRMLRFAMVKRGLLAA